MALSLPKEYTKKFIPNIGKNGIINKEKASLSEQKNLRRSNSGKLIFNNEINKDTEIENDSHLISTKNVVSEFLKSLILKKKFG